MRLDRPIGIWLLLLPSLWSISLASGGVMNFNTYTYKTIVLFLIGAIIMRGAGCVVNDLWDRDLDAQVMRTKNRPLASGAISQKKGVVFLATLLLFGLIILMQFNITTIYLGLISLPLIMTYPLMKRITYYPQIFLGVTFNFSALMGWSAITGTVSTSALLLFLGGVFWTIGYDTIYAYQDTEDDALIGIKSTALKWGDKSKLFVGICYGVAFISFTTAILMLKVISPLLLFMALPALHFLWQIKCWDLHDKNSALRVFKSNRDVGILILFCALL